MQTVNDYQIKCKACRLNGPGDICRVDRLEDNLKRKEHCPCNECLIKVTCTSFCDTFIIYFFKQEGPSWKQYA